MSAAAPTRNGAPDDDDDNAKDDDTQQAQAQVQTEEDVCEVGLRIAAARRQMRILKVIRKQADAEDVVVHHNNTEEAVLRRDFDAARDTLLRLRRKKRGLDSGNAALEEEIRQRVADSNVAREKLRDLMAPFLLAEEPESLDL